MLIVAAVALGSESWPGSTPPPPLAGFSFSPITSQDAHRDPAQDLARLLDATNPDLVRLPIYWELVQPTPRTLDFSSVDSLLEVVARHNATAERQTRVVLTIGARNFLYPELHQPAWAGERSQPQLAWEMAEVHRLDPGHKAVTTTYNGMNTTVDLLELLAPQLVTHMGTVGHPEAALQVGDALGLDVYIDGPSVPLRDLTSVDLRSKWKQQTVRFWADRAHAMGKDVWLAEMQAQPWDSSGTFAPEDLVESAIDYRQEPLQVVLMWGVETWLNDPAWMAAGARALDILQAQLA